MDAVEWSDLHLNTVGEDGNDPIDFEVNFVAGELSGGLLTSAETRDLLFRGNVACCV
jgi:hypothetical protein